MKLLKFPWLVLIKILKFMKTPDLINISLTSRRLREQYTNEINPGQIEIEICNYSADIWIGEFEIKFSSFTTDDIAPIGVRTIGPFTFNVFCLFGDENKSWETVVEDIYTPCWTLAQYYMTIFPKAELGLFCCQDELNERTLQLLSSWDLDLFKEKLFKFPVESENNKNLANQYCKKNHMSAIGYHWDKINIGTKNYGEVESKFRFSDCWLSDKYWTNYVLVSGLKIGIEAWRDLIKTWIRGKLNELIFVRASVVTGLNMLEVTEGFRTHIWNNEEMAEFEGRTHFSAYFEQKGIIIHNNFGRKASLHFDQENSIFTMVVWNTRVFKKCLFLFPEIQALF
ncbi:hypothetical protein CRE_24103 [Caenorhabditis remanei]|uniref:F-box domain-containing protein n=1 Tax=Caenorhabditis remanei TaxID=31234 RepID=E3MVL3_CAERE|nr:hypothetical protein CRE_24103 [Caenorhabditis remanei]